MGSYGRQRGHRWERDCANNLALEFGKDIRTTRSLGANYGSDLAHVTAYDSHRRPALHTPIINGWCIECKAVKTENRWPRGWLQQATDQAVVGVDVVVLWKKPRATFMDCSAFLWDEGSSRGWREVTIFDWLGIVHEQEEAA